MKKLLLMLLFSSFFIGCVKAPQASQNNLYKEKNLDKRFEKVSQLAEANIYNPAELESEAWKEFATYLNSDAVKALEGKAYENAFNLASSKLPFSHFYIRSTKPTSPTNKKNGAQKAAFEVEAVNEETVVLHVRKFAQDAAGMVKVVEQIKAGNYENLIIDLRGNSGGTLDAPVVLGMFLSNTPIDAGSYLNRGWFESNNRLPSKEEIQGFPFLKDFTYKGFSAVQGEKAFRMFLPPHDRPVYEGNVYLLTDNSTASACEPFVDVLQRNNIATVVGETTSGAMLSAQWFKINNDYSIFIPVTYYVNSEGEPIDKIGVSPDIEVPADKALEEVLRRLSEE